MAKKCFRRGFFGRPEPNRQMTRSRVGQSVCGYREWNDTTFTVHIFEKIEGLIIGVFLRAYVPPPRGSLKLVTAAETHKYSTLHDKKRCTVYETWIMKTAVGEVPL